MNQRSGRSPWLYLSIGLRLLLVALLGYAVTHQDLPQYSGKAMAGRAIFYPLATLVVPAAWWLASRRSDRPIPYPWATDILFILPFLVDTLGNAANLYDTIGWWDDFNHFLNWAILVLGLGFALAPPLRRSWTGWVLLLGIGTILAVLWEFAEYLTFVRGGPEEATAYTDTMGDLALGMTGSALAATGTLVLARRSRMESGPTR